MQTIAQVLQTRDGLSKEEAEEQVQEFKQRFAESDDPFGMEEEFEEEFGLEPDYFEEILFSF